MGWWKLSAINVFIFVFVFVFLFPPPPPLYCLAFPCPADYSHCTTVYPGFLYTILSFISLSNKGSTKKNTDCANYKLSRTSQKKQKRDNNNS